MDTSVISVRPVRLPAPERGDDLRVRVSAPTTGDRLPLIVFSHGYHQSMDGYAPLVDHWAANGFVVVQPTHLDSASLDLAPNDPRQRDIWRIRVDDVVRVLDELDLIEAAVPGLAGRIDRERIAVAGHSWGAQTASMLLGARVVGGEDRTDPRVRAGVLLALTGTGGDNLTPFAAEHFPFMNPDFSALATPSLLVAGDKDQSMLSDVGPEWFTEAYALSPGIKNMLIAYGGEHTLGGISGYASTETTDENPERVDMVRRLSTAFLRTALDPSDPAWREAAPADPHGRVESRDR